MLRKYFFLFAIASLLPAYIFSQVIVPQENTGKQNYDRLLFDGLSIAGSNKKLPQGYEQQTLLALSHFPELKDVPVKFKIKKSFATLKTRPSFVSFFRPKGKRTYVITISDKTIQKLNPIMFKNLPFDAQVGVIGHELSHVVDFSKKTTWQCFKTAINHFSPTYMDSLEFHTDEICIKHGLGNQLEAWSSYIRHTMHTAYWRGSDYVYKGDTKYERYMNPSTIEKYMSLTKK